MVSIIPTRLHWLKDDGLDCPNDLCAHSPVNFSIGKVSLLTAADGDFTVSASSIYLLRSLTSNHIIEPNTEAPLSGTSTTYENLFPCCGHTMIDNGEFDVQITGCPNGSNFNVTHLADSIRVHVNEQTHFDVRQNDWKSAVLSFVDTVREFYNNSELKTPADDFASAGYNAMIAEWDRRREIAG
jgi:hypothetical protein